MQRRITMYIGCVNMGSMFEQHADDVCVFRKMQWCVSIGIFRGNISFLCNERKHGNHIVIPNGLVKPHYHTQEKII
ncbi:hypothetical protein MT325_m832R [Paramecium bursaria chlorella virus MT325]|uniref:Uncharacterized protein m832R n=1 Tax=Paramecium bursaria Chlorella virus MT325 TaxID=346932 RepID=A7IVL2_PBCVM|nr:hypothetical protein MT325_m832R [Paramecium bursaria chlorella virus MT325]